MGCAAHSNLAPVGKGKVSGNFSIGGPVVAVFDTYLPIPYATAGVNYGAQKDVNLNCNLHLIAPLFGIIGIAPGIAFFPIANKGAIPTVAVQEQFMLLTSVKGGVEDRFRMYSISTLSLAWQAWRGMSYCGMNMTTQPFSKPDYDSEAVPVICSPFIGYRWDIGKKMRLLTELKWQGANVRSDQLAVDYIGIGGYGAIAPLVSIEREF